MNDQRATREEGAHLETGNVAATDTNLYRRELPGGGYVAIDRGTRAGADAELPIARLYVERRTATDRRSGHVPPVLVELEGDGSSAEFGRLYHMARDNAALARALLTRRPTDLSVSG